MNKREFHCRFRPAVALAAVLFAQLSVAETKAETGTAVPASQADRDYQAFQDVMRVPAPRPYGQMSPREIDIYLEELHMALRDKAVIFLNEHPTDPRRWSIVVNLAPGMPRFVLQWGEDNAEGEPDVSVDETAAQNWKRRVTALKMAMNDAKDLPEDVRNMQKGRAARAEMAARRQAFLDRWRNGGEMAPDFATYDLAGHEVKLSDFRGKVVILDFWASWCGPCKAAMPHVQKLARHYKDQGVVVLAAGTSDARADFEKFVKDNKANYPDVIWTHDKAERSDDRASKKLYEVMGIPAQFVIDREGKVVDVVVGYFKGEMVLDAALAKTGIKIPTEVIDQGKAEMEKRAATERLLRFAFP